jgi:hypothetical protein
VDRAPQPFRVDIDLSKWRLTDGWSLPSLKGRRSRSRLSARGCQSISRVTHRAWGLGSLVRRAQQ